MLNDPFKRPNWEDNVNRRFRFTPDVGRLRATWDSGRTRHFSDARKVNATQTYGKGLPAMTCAIDRECHAPRPAFALHGIRQMAGMPLRACAAIAFLLSALASAAQPSSRPPLRVAGDQNYPPLSYLDPTHVEQLDVMAGSRR